MAQGTGLTPGSREGGFGGGLAVWAGFQAAAKEKAKSLLGKETQSCEQGSSHRRSGLGVQK